MKADVCQGLVIVGGGRAGLAAAIEARRANVDTCLIDERPRLGGQMFCAPSSTLPARESTWLDREDSERRRLIDVARDRGARILSQTTVWGIWGSGVALYHPERGASVIHGDQILLATGGRDRPLVFPGWTQPGVCTLSEIQELVGEKRIVPDQRILLAGSGPLVPIVARRLHRAGAHLVMVLEAAPDPVPEKLATLLDATSQAGILQDAVASLAYLRCQGVPFRYGQLVVRAEGAARLERAVVARVDATWRCVPGSEETLEVDCLCLGYGFRPSSELSLLGGCQHKYDATVGGGVPVHDEWQRTTVPGILVAGAASGVAGALGAVDEGRLAGLAAALDLGRLSLVEAVERAAPIRDRLARQQRIQAALTALYPVGPGIDDLITPDTVVCRCEGITAAEIADACRETGGDSNALKGLTRAGMGLCQGRGCERTIANLVVQYANLSLESVTAFTPRPPVRPVPLGSIADLWQAD